jgi:hypothetical protein
VINLSTTPKNTFYNNTAKDREHNIYTEEYFGGSDCFIYIGKTRYDNISALQFQVRETVKPIYGYASRIYDDLAVGTRIVQGVIKVPVKNRGANDKLTDSTNNGTYTLTKKVSTANVPDWVYKYQPADSEKGSPNIGYSDNTDSATVAKVQAALQNKYPNAGVQVSGVLDFPTKQAIATYKEDNNLLVNTNCDNELTNRLIYSTQNLVHAVQGCTLKYQPNDLAMGFYSVGTSTKLVVQKVIDSNWILVQADNGQKGYIKKGEWY